MPKARYLLVLAYCLLGFGIRQGLREIVVHAQAGPRIPLNQVRGEVSDLEVRGLTTRPRFVTRLSLEALPQVEAVVARDEDFTEMPKSGVAVRGIDLEVLSRALGVPPAMVAEAVAADGYAANYPAAYTKQHHPILALTVAGMTPKAWAQKTHTGDLGPYFIAYDNFVPAFRVLSHEDRPQVPVQVVRLEFATEQRMFAGIWPAVTAELQVAEGFRIAQQNCFRCHNAAGFGGTKSGRSWAMLARNARQRPEWFARWVHDPQSIDAKSEMPANPKYDRATLAALTKYFASMR